MLKAVTITNMGSANINSILEKAKKYMNSPEGKKRADKHVSDAMKSGEGGQHLTITGMNMAADKFIEVLKNEIKSHEGSNYAGGELGKTAISALMNLEHSQPVKVGENQYQIEVWFSNDLRRESLAPDEYPEGIDNIAALLNNGYAAGHTVYGVWMGHWPWSIPSLPMRDGTHFIDNAIRTYMANYAGEYGVISVTADEIYK